MTRDEVLAMAEQTGFSVDHSRTIPSVYGDAECLKRFAALAFEAGRKAEREEIAAAVELTDIRLSDPMLVMCVASLFTGVAKWIRARSAK